MIQSIDHPQFLEFCQGLAADRDQGWQAWPQRQLRRMADAGVYRWFVSPERGGLGWANQDLAQAYLRMSEACLSSTFVLTQQVAALKRILASPNQALVQQHVDGMLAGRTTATVGISHLTTSRLHLKRPALIAEKIDGGYQLSGLCPWVTGANAVQYVLAGANIHDPIHDSYDQQILALVDVAEETVTVGAGMDLIALSDTHTGRVMLDQVVVPESNIVAGPHPKVLASLTEGPSTGSYQSSALALGLAASAIQFIGGESQRRPELKTGFQALTANHQQIVQRLMQASVGNPSCSNEQVRTEANSLVLRATQAAMVAAKGAGFTQGHPVGRWCQEAMFFLVWSCPQAVQDANLCELAGVG